LERRAISASFVEEALESLRRRGLPTQGVLAAAGLPPTVVEPVSVAAYGRMWLALAETLDDEFFGLTARPMRPGGFTLLCHCLLHAANLETALRRALRFLNLVLEEPRGELIVRDGLARVELHESGPPRSAFAYRTYWIVLHGVICWLARRRLPLRLIDFRCVEPLHCAEYRLFFGAPVQFGQPCSRLAFDQSFSRSGAMRPPSRFFCAERPPTCSYGTRMTRGSPPAFASACVRCRRRTGPTSTAWRGTCACRHRHCVIACVGKDTAIVRSATSCCVASPNKSSRAVGGAWPTSHAIWDSRSLAPFIARFANGSARRRPPIVVRSLAARRPAGRLGTADPRPISRSWSLICRGAAGAWAHSTGINCGSEPPPGAVEGARKKCGLSERQTMNSYCKLSVACTDKF